MILMKRIDSHIFVPVVLELFWEITDCDSKFRKKEFDT